MSAKLKEAEAQADEYKKLVAKRTGLRPDQLVCPREKSDMTPCIARDGHLAVASGVGFVCVGCESYVDHLLAKEREKH